MTEERKEELLKKVLHSFAECSDGAETYHLMHDELGFTNEELVECGMDKLRRHFQYEWAEGMPQRRYADMLDRLLPQPDAHTTAAWVAFAEELADGSETRFEEEMSSIVAAFQEISERFSPEVVNTIYQTVHVPDNALLSNEIVQAAEAVERGASIQEISDMAANGAFEGGPMPTLKM